MVLVGALVTETCMRRENRLAALFRCSILGRYDFKDDGGICGTDVPRGLRYHCTGECMRSAKKNDIYRND